jgi:hypothetical protein
MSALIAAILVKNPEARPSVHDLLRLPFLKGRINSLLEQEDFKEEFSHTLLHN